MIIPSIDLEGGRTVQLVRGEQLAVDAGSPLPIADRFGMVGEIAVIDLDAAKGEGSNAELVRSLLARHRCRVGGGIRDVDTAMRWLDAGAARVILGTAAQPDILEQLPRDRVIAALDVTGPAGSEEVVTHGWRRGSGRCLDDRIVELRDLVGGFLVTFVDVEGTMRGLPVDRARDLVALAAGGDRPVRVTVAGGIRDAAEVGALDRIGADTQVGMALYTGRFTLADAVGACLNSDRPDGLWPTVVCDEAGRALGLCYSNEQSLAAALDQRRGVYWSRRRGLWAKGESSGQGQELLAVDLDCDRDCLRCTVRQLEESGRRGVFCHTGTRTCWGPDGGLHALARRLAAGPSGDPKSYTARLLKDPDLLAAKLAEETQELIAAQEPGHIAEEAADLMYFAFVRLVASGVPLHEVERALDRRALKVKRRGGDAKPAPTDPGHRGALAEPKAPVSTSTGTVPGSVPGVVSSSGSGSGSSTASASGAGPGHHSSREDMRSAEDTP